MGPRKNLAGQRFGHLTVIECAGKLDGKRYSWKCLCDCGKETYVLGSALTSGNTKSCGCQKHKGIENYNKENSDKAKIPIGTKFGKLTVIKDLGYRKQVQGHNRRWYLCRCDCGQLKEVMGNCLKQRQVQSCGQCSFQSKGEFQIKEILDNNNINYIYDSIYPELLLETKRRLRFDFTIYDKNNQLIRFIEFDGRQHTKGPDKGLWTQSDSLDAIKERDKIKNNFCKRHNYELVRIPYTKSQITLEDLLGDKYLIKGDDCGDD